MSRVSRIAAVTLRALLLVSVPLAVVVAQEPSTPDRPIFRTGVDILPLDVTVLDKYRRPVRGLTVADFHVRIDGEDRPIIALENVVMPDRVRARARWMNDVPPDVSTNGFTPDRVIVLFLDDYFTGRDASGAVFVRKIANAVLDELGPADLVGIVYPVMTQRGVEFTTDKAKLRAAVDRFTVAATGPGESGMCMRGECVLDVMRAAAAAARGWPDRRKLLVYISPEGHYQSGAYDANGDSSAALVDSTPALMNTFRELQRSNITVYQFDPRGLEEMMPGINAQQRSAPVLGGGGGMLPTVGMFAYNTGGLTVTRTNDPWLRVPEMFIENESYYMLGVSMPAAKSPPGYRRIRVQVTRPDLTVRSRNGYFDREPERRATSSNAVTDLDRAMTGPVPLADLPLSLTATAFRVPGTYRAAVAVAAGVDGSAGEGDQMAELVVRAFDERSQVRASKGAWTSRVRLRPQVSALGAVHYDTLTRLELPPGPYEVRLSMQRAADKLAGGVTTSIVIPDFDRDRVSVSGIVLGRFPDAALTRGAPLADVLPFAPTTRRSFTPAEAITALVRVYQGGRERLRPASLGVRIINDADAAVVTATKDLPPESFVGSTRAAEYRLQLPLSELPAGEYLLTMAATIEKHKAEPRPVRFRVRR